jgi:hypothetical protein
MSTTEQHCITFDDVLESAGRVNGVVTRTPLFFRDPQR